MLWALLAFPAVAVAQPPAASNERAAAQVLFDAGRQAMADKNFDEACAKFEESHRLDPAAGTLLNLGNCEEKRGRPASAWDRYKGAIGQLREGDRRRVFAEKKIAELMPGVPHLTVYLAEDAPEGSEVRRNETPISGSLGIPLPLNPGLYEVVAEAPSFEPMVVEVELGLGEQKTITIRPGNKLPPEPDPTPETNFAADSPAADSGFSQTTWGYLIGGVGAASGGTSLVLTFLALGSKSDVQAFCGNSPETHNETKCADATSSGRTLTSTATVLGVAGGVGLALGAILILADSDEASEGTQVEAGAFERFTGVRVRGSF